MPYEFEVSDELIMLRMTIIQPKFSTRLTRNGKAILTVWTCFIPEIEDWIVKSYPESHLGSISVRKEYNYIKPLIPPIYDIPKANLGKNKHIYYAQFFDKADAALFKLFWI